MRTIIFSKDRAMQLDALLRSMRLYAPQLGRPHVLWTASTEEFRRGYAALRWDHAGSVCFHQQLSFYHETLALTRTAPDSLLCYLVDDCLFYRQLPEFTVEPGTAYAPRLGKNTTYCYMADRPQRLPHCFANGAVQTCARRESLADGDLDFDCTFSLDGHVCRREEIVPYLEQVRFDNPNEMEGVLHSVIRPQLTFGEQSCLVGIPHNSVGPQKSNRHEGGSAAELNRQYLQGHRVHLAGMDFSQVTGVHQNVPYAFFR